MIRKLSRNTREYGETDSTNREMQRLLEQENLEEGTVLRAEYQTRGKGHQGNTWVSDRGANLLFSILLKPEFLAVETAFHLSRIASLSLVDILDKQDIRALIKWPNDILVGERKICGILIENSISGSKIMHSVIGIGLNVNQKQFKAGIPDPTSLSIEKGCHFDRNNLLEDFRSAMESWYQALFTGNAPRIMDAYLGNLYRLGEETRFSDGKGIFKGVICGVLPGGELEVRPADGGIRTFGFKEIEYLRQPAGEE